MTILSQVKVFEPNVLLIFISIAIMVFSMLFINIAVEYHDRTLLKVMILIFLFSFIFMSMVDICIISPKDTGRYQYKCLIEDNINFVDIAAKYEVIGQEGEAWILEDKE